jgi:hypothetical protein
LIFTNIDKKIKPSNYNDLVAMTHDFNYVIANGDHTKMNKADDLAISYTDNSPLGGFMRWGLYARKVLHLKETPDPNITTDTILTYRQRLRDNFYEDFQKYNLNPYDMLLPF